MANYATLKAAVQAVVKSNGVQSITGANLQSTLISMIESLGANYTFAGVSTPSTSPGTPDQNVFYIGGAGTYTNFGSSYTVPEGGIGIFCYNGSWANSSIRFTKDVLESPMMADATIIPSDNIFTPAYIIKDKYIRSSSPYDIIDLSGGVLSGFYKLPSDARTLKFTGITLSSGNIFVRFSQKAVIDGTATTLQFSNGTAKDISSYYAQGYRYWCFTAYRGSSAEGIDLSSVSVTLTTGSTDSVGEVPKIYEQINGADFSSFIDGYVKSSDGTFNSAVGYKTSQYMAVSEGDKIYYKGYASSSVMLISCYSTDSGNAMTTAGKYVQGWNVSEVREGLFVVPSGVNYIRVSLYGSYISESFISVNETILMRLEDCESSLKDLDGEYAQTSWTQGYIATDGTVNTVSGNYYYSGYIPVSEGDIYDIGCSGSGSVLVLSGYSSESQSNIITSFNVVGNGSYNHLTGKIPSGVNYIRVVYNTGISGGNYYVRIGGKIDEIEAEIKYIESKLPSVHDTNYVASLKEYINISPKKACVVFEFDANQGSQNDAINYAAALKAGGINVATFGILSSSFSDNSYVNAFLQLQSEGHEINWHTLPADSIGSSNPEPHPTVSEYRTILARELAAFEAKGYATPIGVITSQGAMVADLIPITKEYLCYGHTTANTPAKGTQESVLAAVNTTATDRYMVNRIGLENLAEDDASVEATLLANAKAAVDQCVADNGLLVFYTHWYDNNTRQYWLRESVLTPLLAHIKAYIDGYRLISATMADIANIYLRQ